MRSMEELQVIILVLSSISFELSDLSLNVTCIVY